MSPRSLALRAAEVAELIVAPSALLIFRDACAMALPQANGTLFDVVKKMRSTGGLPEVCVAFYCSRMLRALELLFSADVLHADLKLDNWVVAPAEDLGSSDDDGDGPSKAAPWPLKVTLIDFGRAIDRRAYPTGTRFRFEESTLDIFGRDVAEIVCGAQWRGEPTSASPNVGWAHEIDLHAAAVSILHMVVPSGSAVTSILERHMQTCISSGPQNEVKMGDHSAPDGFRAPRGWNSKIWGSLLGDLLNPRRGKALRS